MLRLLLIEDDPERVKTFRSWLPDDIRLVVAASVGRAIGTLERDGKGVYSGILLDHDLQIQAATEEDTMLSGSHLVDKLIRLIDRSVPILIHSRSPGNAPRMAARLSDAGFSVTRIPMHALTRDEFLDWLDDVRSTQ